jgi:uncharacterized repeat protein (TIGR03843 family)
MERLLTEGEITETRGVMRWGSNYAALVTICDSETESTAVYKPQRGERPLWDFPDGTLCYREVVAYLVSQALGWQLVPPTVLRTGSHGMGSMQLFIPHNPEINYFALDDSFTDQLQRYTIFDYLINNADRKGGHLLLDATGKLWGIDHGLSFHIMPKLRTVIWDFAGQQIADDLIRPVRDLYEQLDVRTSKLRCGIEKLLSQAEITALTRRTKQLLDCQTYPNPGSGPNYPWPPV